MYYKNLLSTGGEFLKYGRKGRPHPTVLKMDSELNKLSWGDKTASVSDVVQVLAGRSTDVFQKADAKLNAKTDAALLSAATKGSFSIVFVNRTLDLEGTPRNRDAWVDALQWAAKKKRQGRISARRVSSKQSWYAFKWTPEAVAETFSGELAEQIPAPGRTFLRNTVVRVMHKSKLTQQNLFMFHDVLVLASVATKAKPKVRRLYVESRWYFSTVSCLCSPLRFEYFVLKHPLPSSTSRICSSCRTCAWMSGTTVVATLECERPTASAS